MCGFNFTFKPSYFDICDGKMVVSNNSIISVIHFDKANMNKEVNCLLFSCKEKKRESLTVKRGQLSRFLEKENNIEKFSRFIFHDKITFQSICTPTYLQNICKYCILQNFLCFSQRFRWCH